MELVKMDEGGFLYLSPDVDDWEPVETTGTSAVIDLDSYLPWNDRERRS